MGKHRMMKLGGQVLRTKISAEFEFGGHSPPPGRTTPKNVAFCWVAMHEAKRKQSHAGRRNIASDAACA